jgi:SAM-dependent methyltransferase
VSGADDAGLAPEAAYWDERYRSGGKLWGDGPSELARLAVARLSFAAGRGFDLLDVGCGYGRDSIYLAAELGCRVLGIDPSPVAVSAARRGRRGDLDVEFEAGDPESIAAATGAAAEGRTPSPGFDVVYASNVYHLLPPARRRAFAAAVSSLLRPGGLLFLSTLSPRDPQHYAKGEPVEGEERSWVEHCYLHFCTADELADDFAGLELLDIEERSYEERHADGRLHHHTSWFMEARRPR